MDLWEEQWDEYGNAFFVNQTTGESSWDFPIEAPPMLEYGETDYYGEYGGELEYADDEYAEYGDAALVAADDAPDESTPEELGYAAAADDVVDALAAEAAEEAIEEEQERVAQEEEATALRSLMARRLVNGAIAEATISTLTKVRDARQKAYEAEQVRIRREAKKNVEHNHVREGGLVTNATDLMASAAMGGTTARQAAASQSATNARPVSSGMTHGRATHACALTRRRL